MTTNFAKRNEIAKVELEKIILWALTELLLVLIVKILLTTITRHWAEQPLWNVHLSMAVSKHHWKIFKQVLIFYLKVP